MSYRLCQNEGRGWRAQVQAGPMLLGEIVLATPSHSSCSFYFKDLDVSSWNVIVLLSDRRPCMHIALPYNLCFFLRSSLAGEYGLAVGGRQSVTDTLIFRALPTHLVRGLSP